MPNNDGNRPALYSHHPLQKKPTMLGRFRIGTKLTTSFAIILLLMGALICVMLFSYKNIDNSTGNILGAFDRATSPEYGVSQGGTDIASMEKLFLTYLSTRDLKYLEDFQVLSKKVSGIFTEIHKRTPLQSNKDAAQRVLDICEAGDKGLTSYIEQEKTVQSIMANGTAAAKQLDTKIESIIKILSEASKGHQEIDVTTFEQLRLSEEIRGSIASTLLARNDLYAASNDETFEEAVLELPKRMNALGDQLQELQKLCASGPLAESTKECVDIHTQWKSFAAQFVPSVKKRIELRKPLSIALDEISGITLDMMGNMIEAVHEHVTGQRNLVGLSRTIGFLVGGVAFAIGIFVCIALTADISSGIKRAIVALNLIINDGIVSFDIPPEDAARKDEVGDLCHAFAGLLKQFQNVERLANELADGNYTSTLKVRGDKDTMNIYLNKMLDQTNSVLHEINESVTQVTTGSNEVTNAAQSLSSGAQEAAASLEQITASMNEISGQTRKNAESATQARDLAQKASKAANDGQEAMKDMTNAMERITHNSSEIQRVIKVIDDIAFQTNLLALNAAVEAARAGQHGKGFAVVAEEVRNLASRSAKAARETSDLIAKSGSEIEKGGEVASHTASVLDTIVEQIKETTELVGGIATASNEQALGVNQVSIGLQQIDSVTQQNTAAAEESASAANEMSAMAGNLQKIVEQFKLRT
jgi:methyl-accepting chemotaxis protein